MAGCQPDQGNGEPASDAPTSPCQAWTWQFTMIDARPDGGFGPSLAVTADEVIVASIRATGALGDLTVASKPLAGETWDIEDLTASGSHTDRTDLVVAADGSVHVAFQEAFDGLLRIASRRDVAWSVATFHGEAQRIGNIPSLIAVDDKLEVAHADSYDALSNPTPLLYSVIDGANLETRELVNRGGTFAAPTALDAARDGTTTGVLYAFTDGNTSKADLSVVTFNGDAPPTSTTIVPPTSGFQAIDVHLARAGAGAWLAVFAGNFENQPAVEVDGVYRAASQGAAWEVDPIIAPIGACHTALVVDDEAQAYVIATVIETGGMSLSFGPAFGAWVTEAVPVPEAFGAAQWPALAVDAKGRLHVAFLSYRDETSRLAYAVGTPTPTACPDATDAQ